MYNLIIAYSANTPATAQFQLPKTCKKFQIEPKAHEKEASRARALPPQSAHFGA